jgi:hypothetical protein
MRFDFELKTANICAISHIVRRNFGMEIYKIEQKNPEQAVPSENGTKQEFKVYSPQIDERDFEIYINKFIQLFRS